MTNVNLNLYLISVAKFICKKSLRYLSYLYRATIDEHYQLPINQ